MPETFVPLRELVRPAPLEEMPPPQPAPIVMPPQSCDDFDAFFAEMRRFRAALRESFDAVRERLLNDIACEVVARELALAPADIVAIVERAFERIEDPRCARVHPSDVPALARLDISVREDASLHRGDAIIEVRDECIDASLGVRLERVLRALDAA